MIMPDGSESLTPAELQSGRLGRIGRRLLAEAAADCSASGVALWLVSADGATMLGALNHGPATTVVESASVPVAESVVGMVAANGLAASIGPGDHHNTSVDERTGIETRAMIAVPVLVGGKLVGVLSAINPTQALLFSAEDQEKLSWKAYLLGLVLADK
jgi:putative methionine-R-sulfoxide reductase with GAF domain